MARFLQGALWIGSLCWVARAAPSRRAASGSQSYHVYLESLEVSAGSFSPKWSPEHASYEIFIKDPKLTEATLLMGLDFKKYRQFEQPHIFIDGERLQYSLLDDARYEINLQEDDGALDRTIEIKVEDPQGPGPWYQIFKNRQFTYYLRLLQPPETAKITRAQAIAVTGVDKRRLAISPAYNQNSDNSDYTFHLARKDTHPEITITCSEFATSLILEGREVQSGTPQTIDMSNAFEKHLLASCQWEDSKYSRAESRHGYSRAESRARRTYSIHMVRDGTISMNMRVEVSLLEYSQGACNQKVKGDLSQGWTCRVLVDHPDLLLGVTGNDVPEIHIIKDEGDTGVKLYNLVPTEVRLGGGVHNYKLRFSKGSAFKDIPITFFNAQTCSEAKFRCPKGKGLKYDADQIPCLTEECTVEDADTCCAPLASCNSFTSPGCPAEHPLRKDAADVHCQAIVCSKADKQCCEGEGGEEEKASAPAVALPPPAPESTDRSIYYYFGTIHDVNADATYDVRFDFGRIDHHVPQFCVRYFPVDTGISIAKPNLKVGDRVEARVTWDERLRLAKNGIGVLSIATREKLAHYARIGCDPVPKVQCGAASSPRWITPQHLPHLPANPETPDNPNGLPMCYFDDRCSSVMPDQLLVGCKAGGSNLDCRYCGFGPFPSCPVIPDCTVGNPSDWDSAKQTWCCKNFMYGCPYECRLDIMWTWAKRNWCCKNEGIGCMKEVDTSIVDASIKTSAQNITNKYELPQHSRRQAATPESVAPRPRRAVRRMAGANGLRWLPSTPAALALFLGGLLVLIAVLSFALGGKVFGRTRARCLCPSPRVENDAAPMVDAQPLRSSRPGYTLVPPASS